MEARERKGEVFLFMHLLFSHHPSPPHPFYPSITYSNDLINCLAQVRIKQTCMWWLIQSTHKTMSRPIAKQTITKLDKNRKTNLGEQQIDIYENKGGRGIDGCKDSGCLVMLCTLINVMLCTLNVMHFLSRPIHTMLHFLFLLLCCSVCFCSLQHI